MRLFALFFFAFSSAFASSASWKCKAGLRPGLVLRGDDAYDTLQIHVRRNEFMSDDSPTIWLSSYSNSFKAFKAVSSQPSTMVGFRVEEKNLLEFLYELSGINFQASREALEQEGSLLLPVIKDDFDRPLFVELVKDKNLPSTVVYISPLRIENRDYEQESIRATAAASDPGDKQYRDYIAKLLGEDARDRFTRNGQPFMRIVH